MYTLGFISFCVVLAILEQIGLSQEFIGYAFLFATIFLYAGIGFLSKTNEPDNYYVAGRRVPALFNGMATGADWMSAASFIGMAGGLYVGGYKGLAFIMGWTGGYVFVALLLAPFLRRFGHTRFLIFGNSIWWFHAPPYRDFHCNSVLVYLRSWTDKRSWRYHNETDWGGIRSWCIFGACWYFGVLFSGGMRAVTWTQVSQYIVLIIAYLIPVVWLSVTQTGNPIPQLSFGQQLQKVSDLEEKIN